MEKDKYSIVKISNEYHKRLKIQAALESRSMKDIIESLLDEYLKGKADQSGIVPDTK